MPRVKLFDEDEVLYKAMNLFWKQGYEATSIQDLVTHLGINRASLYATFGDKEKLFTKSFALYRRSSIEGLAEFFQSHPNVKQGFLELFSKAIQEAVCDKDQKGCFVVNSTTECIPNDESLEGVLTEHKKAIEQLFYEYLKKGKKSQQLDIHHDLKSLASLFYIVYNGLRVVSKVRPNEKELSNSIRTVLSLL